MMTLLVKTLPLKEEVFETFKDEKEYQAHLASEIRQSQTVVPEENTDSRKRPAETPLED